MNKAFLDAADRDSPCLLDRKPACMVKALSQDLRDWLIAAVAGGTSCNAAAKRFGVAVSTAVRWVHA